MSQPENTTDQLAREREQFSHAMRLRNGPYIRAMQAIRKRDGAIPACGHAEAGDSIDHLNPELIPCLLLKGKYHPDHSLENLRIVCFRCNSHKGGPKGATNINVSVRESPTLAQPEWSSKEGSKSERMRSKWNNWIKEKPFVTIQLIALTKMAPHTLGEGSSITYRRYAEEDIVAGVLEAFTVEGQTMVRLTDKETRMLIEQKENEQGNKTI